MKTDPKILVIKLRYIGDVLLTTPILRILRNNFPQARITALVNEGTEAVLQQNPCLDDIAVLPGGNWVKQIQFLNLIRSRRFDCVIDLSDGDRSAILTAISGAEMKIGLNNEGRVRGRAYSWSVQGQYGTMHMVDYYAQALTPLGIEPRICDPEWNVSDDESQVVQQILSDHGLANKKWIMLHPAARYWFKAWPADRFAAIGTLFAKEGYQIVLVGSEDEQNVAQEVICAAKETIINLVGKTSIRELGALMKVCDLFIGNDAGPMHMAAAVGCPVVGLFGPTDPTVWGPMGKKIQTIYKGLDCRECFHPGCQRGEMSCMNLIGVEEVLKAAKALMYG